MTPHDAATILASLWTDLQIIVEPMLGDDDGYWMGPNTVVVGRSTYAQLRFDCWMDRIERGLRRCRT